jgi:hypothetical protein
MYVPMLRDKNPVFYLSAGSRNIASSGSWANPFQGAGCSNPPDTALESECEHN